MVRFTPKVHVVIGILACGPYQRGRHAAAICIKVGEMLRVTLSQNKTHPLPLPIPKYRSHIPFTPNSKPQVPINLQDRLATMPPIIKVEHFCSVGHLTYVLEKWYFFGGCFRRTANKDIFSRTGCSTLVNIFSMAVVALKTVLETI